MSKKLAVIRLAASIACAAIVLAPMGAMGQPASPVVKVATSKSKTSKTIECTKEADARDLQGKARKRFLSECKKVAST